MTQMCIVQSVLAIPEVIVQHIVPELFVIISSPNILE